MSAIRRTASRTASLSRTTLRRHIVVTLAPALAVLGLMVAPATHALAAQTFTCNYSSASMNATVPLSDGSQVHLTVGERAGHYAGITVQPLSTGVSEAGKEAQCLLLRAGFSPGPIDGIFGPMSQTAARHFQATVDSACRGVLSQDGNVGPKTWPWLRWYTAAPIGCGGV